MDELYSVNPKERGEVRAGIEPVFEASHLRRVGSLRLAPAWHCLDEYADRLLVVSGIQTNTVAHATGDKQTHQMRLDTALEPTFTTRIGEFVAPEAPLHAIQLGARVFPPLGRVFVDDSTGSTLRALHRAANDQERAGVARGALRSAERECAGGELRSIRAAQMLLERMSGTSMDGPFPDEARIAPGEWPMEEREFFSKRLDDGSGLGMALYVLQNDLAPCVFLPVLASWDTHTENALQVPLSHQCAMYLRHLLRELDTRVDARGVCLSKQVAILITSELGRFPYLTSYGGKDHFSQISAVLIGPGLRSGHFGETNLEMVGEKVSLATGRSGPRGSLLTLDDLGRTVLEWFGHPAPGAIGYKGRVMEFCLG